jgi:hypothetical protein
MSKSMLKRINVQQGKPMDYPQGLCRGCGGRYCKRKPPGVVAPWHLGRCDICKKDGLLTPRKLTIRIKSFT